MLENIKFTLWWDITIVTIPKTVTNYLFRW